MSIFDFLKRKREVEKAKEKKSSFAKATEGQVKTEKKTEKTLIERETRDLSAQTGKKQATRSKRDIKGFSYDIVKEPHISEKATLLGDKNKYVFKIYKSAKKSEIKKSVQGIYGVDVLAVNVIKIPNKKRRLGRSEGFKKGYRKAVVTIKEGQKIEIF